MHIDTNTLEQWAQSHETATEIARAIFNLAHEEDEAQRIWDAPEPGEIVAVYDAVVTRGGGDPSQLFWGVDSLETVYGQR
jgi:hypothetical protein